MYRFNGNEIVKLKRDLPDFRLKAGDTGILWGIYAFDPPLYEATFINSNGDEFDAMFIESDVEEVLDVTITPHSKRFEEISVLFTQLNAKIKNQSND